MHRPAEAPGVRPAAPNKQTCVPFQAGPASGPQLSPEGSPSGVSAPPPCPTRPRPLSQPEPRPGRPTRAADADTQRHQLAPRPRRHPEPRALPLSLSSSSVTAPLYFLSFLLPAPGSQSVSRVFSRYRAAALSRALCSPPPWAASHIFCITLGAARRSPGPGFERAVDNERTSCAPSPPPSPLCARSVATRSGLSGGDVPL